VAFDVDDTLYLERDYVRSGFSAVGSLARQHFGVEDFAARAWAHFVDGVRGSIFDHVFADLGIDLVAADLAALVDCYRTHEPAISLAADARDCLQQMHGRMPLAVITDGPAASQHAKVRALGLSNWMRTVVATADLGPALGKPDPAAFALVEDRCAVPGAACSYVADNPHKDFAGAKGRGWTTVRVRRAGGLHRDAPSDTFVDHELPDLSQLLAHIEAIA